MSATRSHDTGWILPATPIGGRDHLGVQAPCEAIYTRLLPGITNGTDRARYYSFHPWVVRHFDQRYPERSVEAFKRVIRRAECLFALIAIRHGRGGDPGSHAAIVGWRELQKVTADEFDLGDFAGLEAPRQYFKNHRGGLGQYYFGPLRDLRVLDHASGKGQRSVPSYDPERGLALATALDAGVDADQFFRVLEAPTVRASDLDALVTFCPCHLLENELERERLRDLFLARSALYDRNGDATRRATLGLLLALLEGGAGRHPDLRLEGALRVACYAGVLPGGGAWKPPDKLANVYRGWRAYQRNELFSVALQGLFAAVLRAVARDRDGRLASAAEAGPLALALCEGLGARLLGEHLPVAAARFAGELPAIELWEHDAHEMQMGRRIGSAPKDEVEGLAADSVRVLLALAARGLGGPTDADQVLDPAYFDPQELHLLSFQHHLETEWASLTVGDWIAWLAVRWGIERHLQVALRKLRAQRQDTFRIRPVERGLQVVEAPEPGFTIPRIGRAAQILQDIGLVDAVLDRLALTADGRKELGRIRG